GARALGLHARLRRDDEALALNEEAVQRFPGYPSRRAEFGRARQQEESARQAEAERQRRAEEEARRLAEVRRASEQDRAERELRQARLTRVDIAQQQTETQSARPGR